VNRDQAFAQYFACQFDTCLVCTSSQDFHCREAADWFSKLCRLIEGFQADAGISHRVLLSLVRRILDGGRGAGQGLLALAQHEEDHDGEPAPKSPESPTAPATEKKRDEIATKFDPEVECLRIEDCIGSCIVNGRVCPCLLINVHPPADKKEVPP